jgi:DNA-binding YbaB/EbfC family protein
MFDKMRAMFSLLGNAGKIREEMEKLQGRLGEIVAEGDAGAGMVKAKVNGRMEVLSVRLTDEAMKDRELLEDLVRSAVGQAIDKARRQVHEETQKVATGLGLPPGMGLPGLG